MRQYEKAAMELFISKSQLTRLVRQHYGMTFHKLISSYRVNAAAKLLCDTDLPADKISARFFGISLRELMDKLS